MFLRATEQTLFGRTAIAVALVMALQGCTTPTGGAATGADRGNAQTGDSAGTNGGSSGGTSGDTLWKVGGCMVVAVTGAALAKAFANAEAKRNHLTKAQMAQRERGYMISFALLGCGLGSVLGGTIYAKLSEAGRKERERALVEAASQARPQRYGDPTNPALQGTIRQGKRYAEADAKRECMDVEDTLSDGSSKDAIFVKMCRSVPNGGWAPVTS